MKKSLQLSFEGSEYTVSLTRIHRDDLYSSVDIEAFDEKGRPADVKVLDSDGKTLIDKGGTGLAMVDSSTNWVSRSELVPVDPDGKPIESVLSSFERVVPVQKVDLEEYLSLLIKSTYSVEAEDDATEGFLKQIRDLEEIYGFDFSFRGGINEDLACLVSNREEVFLAVGNPGNFEYLELNQPVRLDDGEEVEIGAEDITFDLI